MGVWVAVTLVVERKVGAHSSGDKVIPNVGPNKGKLGLPVKLGGQGDFNFPCKLRGSMSILWTKKVERLCCFFKFLILLLLWCQITNRAMYPLTIIPAFYVFKDCSAGFL